MNPFKELPKNATIKYYNWKGLAVKPYDKNVASPYTKTRVILMNGTEFESNMFLHQLNRHCLNNDIRRAAAEVRRSEQQQQKRVAGLRPINETILETTIAYETAEKVSHKKGFRIFNSTRGGKLEAFERVDLDIVINGK